MKIYLCTTLLLAMAGSAWGQNPIVYPAQGQSQQQQEKDQFECYTWAKGNTGFDPMQASAPPSSTEPRRGGVVRGAAGGAIVGGIIDGSDGAKTGAGVGAVVGGVRRGNQARQQQAQQQAYASDQAAQRSTYDRAYGACLEGRGYSVK